MPHLANIMYSFPKLTISAILSGSMKAAYKCVIAGIVCMLLCVSCTNIVNLNTSPQGYYDISGMADSEVCALNGKWGYAAKKFVDPQLPLELYDDFEVISEQWQHYSSGVQPVHSYATYAVKIRGLNTSKIYALYFTRVSSAFIAFVNGSELYRSGVPGTNIGEEIFDWNRKIVVVPVPPDNEITLVVHISNFHDRNSGLEEPFYIGTYDAIREQFIFERLISSGIEALLLVLAIFFLSINCFYPQANFLQLFGLLCLFAAVRNTCYGHYTIKFFLPDISGIRIFRLGYFFFSLIVIAFFKLIFTLFLEDKRLLPLYIPCALYAVCTLLLPINVFMYTILPMQIYSGALAAIAFYTIGYSILKNSGQKTLAQHFLLNFIAVIATAFLDILFSNGVIKRSYFSHFLVLIFLILMALILLIHFSRSMEKLHLELKILQKENTALQRFFPSQFPHYYEMLKKYYTTAIPDNKKLLKTEMFIVSVYFETGRQLVTPHSRQALLSLYNGIITSISSIIKKYNGFIAEYSMKDMLLMFTGTAEETVNCVLEMTALIQHRNCENNIGELDLFNIHSGIHYGNLIIGTIGTEAWATIIAVSDVISNTLRIRNYAQNKNVHIAISGEVYRKLDTLYRQTHACDYHGKILPAANINTPEEVKNTLSIYEIGVLV